MNIRVSAGPLHRFPAFQTNDPAVMAEALASSCGARDFAFRDSPHPFEVKINFLKLKQLALASCQYAGAASFRIPTEDTIRQPFALAGAALVGFGGRQFAVNQDETCVVPAGTLSALNYQDRFSHLALVIESSALRVKLGALLGAPVVGDVDFVATGRFGHPELARLRRLLDFVVAELDRPDSVVAAHALAEFEQLLIVSFLMANRHNFSQLLERERPSPAPWQVRLVEDYIDAHWNEPLTIEKLAGVTGGSVRSIFKAFKNARGVTPMAFVKSIRLRQARRLLENPDRDTSVIGVSFYCGFFNAGHFARHYRTAFGELPSTTLARSRHVSTAIG